MSRWDEYPTAMGRVISVDANAAVATVELAGAEVPASLPDHLWYGTEGGLTVGPGAPVTLLRVLGGYQVVSSFTGSDGAGAPTLGPEILANGGFESGTPGGMPDGWSVAWNFQTGEPNPVSVSTEEPLEGSQCVQIRITPEFVGNTAVPRTIASRIDPGLTYNFSGFVSAYTVAGAPTAQLIVSTGESDGEAAFFFNGGLDQVVATLVNPGEAWPLMSGDFTVPAGHTYFRAVVKAYADAGADAVVRFDGLSLRQRLA